MVGDEIWTFVKIGAIVGGLPILFVGILQAGLESMGLAFVAVLGSLAALIALFLILRSRKANRG